MKNTPRKSGGINLERRRFIVKAGVFTGGTLLTGVIGCAGENSNQSNERTTPNSVNPSNETGLTGKPAATTSTILAEIRGRKKTVVIPPGTYEIDFESESSIVSNVEAKKIIGTGLVTLVFKNVPNDFVCLDFQDKSRIRNLSIEIRPKEANPSGIIAIRFKKILTVERRLAATINVSSVRENINSNLASYGISLDVQRKAFRFRNGPWNSLMDTNSEGKSVKHIVMLEAPDRRPKCVLFSATANGDLQFIEEQAGDEADMDSSFNSCKFYGRSNDNLSPLSEQSRRGITVVEYTGRNMLCKDNVFENIGTAVRLSFPRTEDLSDPLSQFVYNQSGFYGHRKGRVYRSIFRNISRCLHVTGEVTVRSLIMTDNEIIGGQLIYCDGNGGMRSCVISQNIVTDHNEKVVTEYNSTILITRGYFDDNIISDNKIIGNPARFVCVNSTAQTSRGNIVAENTFSGSQEALYFENYKASSSVLISTNTFSPRNGEVPLTLITLGLKQNELVCDNKLTDYGTHSNTQFLTKLIGGRHTRVVIVRNQTSGFPVLPNNSVSSGIILEPFFVQGIQ